MTKDFNEAALEEALAALGPSKGLIRMRGKIIHINIPRSYFMKESQYAVKSGKTVVASGSIFHPDGKSLDTLAINAVCSLAASLGYLPESVEIWRPGKNGATTNHKRAEPRARAKDGEPKYKAVAV